MQPDRGGRRQRRLVDAITEYMEMVKFKRASESTIRTKSRTLGALVRVAGNKWTHDLQLEDFENTIRHLGVPAGPEEAQARKMAGLSPRSGRNLKSLVNDEIALKGFAEWAADHGLLSKRKQALVLKKYFHPVNDDGEIKRIWPVVPVEDWPTVIDVAGQYHPLARILVVLGFLWGRRVSEIPILQWSHLNMEYGEALITNLKRKQEMLVPIDDYLTSELQRWSTWLLSTTAATAVEPSWYVVPARLHPRDIGRGNYKRMEGTAHWPVDPTRPAERGAITKIVHRVLSMYGWTDLTRQGMHTFRRSAMTAWDEIGEIGIAQALAGHKNRSTTEGYTQNRGGIRRMKAAMAKNPFGLVPEPTHKGDNVTDIRTYHRKTG